jgi:hypothetical protein
MPVGRCEFIFPQPYLRLVSTAIDAITPGLRLIMLQRRRFVRSDLFTVGKAAVSTTAIA